MAVKSSKAGLPINTRGTHTQPAPEQRPSPSNPGSGRPRNMAGRKGRSPRGKGK